jgi:hypothetical protein
MEEYLTIIVITIFLAILLLIYSSTFFKTGTKLDKFVLRLPIASQFLIGFGIMVTFLIFVTNYKEIVKKATIETIRDTYTKTLEVFDTHGDKCPILIDSFFYPWQKINDKQYNNPVRNDDATAKMYVANYVFQIIGIYVQQSSSLNVTNTRFLAFFSSLCYSKILKKEWEKYKAFFGVRTQLLIEDLFKINEMQTFNNSDELIDYFNKYSQSEKFLKIISQESSTTSRSVFF